MLSLKHRFGLALLCASAITGCDLFFPPEGNIAEGEGEGEGETPVDPHINCDDVDRGASVAPLMRLSFDEYQNAVHHLFGRDDIPIAIFPLPLEVDGLKNQASSMSESALLAEAELTNADAITAFVMQNPQQLTGCNVVDDTCANTTIDSLVRKAYRRPPTLEERDALALIYDGDRVESDAATALSDVITAILLSPQFLYRVEFGTATDTVQAPLSSHELAARLSFFLWHAPPDAILDAVADDQSLLEPSVLEAQARRMLEDPRAVAMLDDFFIDWLEIDKLDTLYLSSADYDVTDQIRASLRSSLERFITRAMIERRSFSELLASSDVFVDDTLATLLDVPSADGEAQALVERYGLLTQPGLLASTSHDAGHSPIRRGLLVLRKLLCIDIPAPPPTVNAAIDPIPEGELITTREHFEQSHREQSCANCHDFIDGVGFAYENYDALARYRTTERGLPINSQGSIPLSSGIIEVSGAEEFNAQLAQAFEPRRCFADHVYRYALGFKPRARSEQCDVQDHADVLIAHNDDPFEMIVALILSPSFTHRAVEVTP